MVEFKMLIGPAGSGKSTLAHSYEDKENYKVVSSDSIRELLYGDASIQGNPREVFAIVHIRILDYLKGGYNVVYDATNLNAKQRKTFLREIPSSVWVEAVVCACSIESCIERQEHRDRKVPEHVIERQFRHFDFPQYFEGFNKISYRVLDNRTFSLGDLLTKANSIAHDNQHHEGTIYDHIQSAYQYSCRHFSSALINEVMLLHDIGKIYTKSFFNAKGDPSIDAHYYGHEHVSAIYSLLIGGHGLSEKDSESLIYRAQLIDLHMAMHGDTTKLEKKLSQKSYQDLCMIHECDENAL